MASAASPRATKQQDGEVLTLRAHRVFTLGVIVLSLGAGILQYFGNPISCWTPVQFTREMADYAESSCYFSPSYYLPFNKDNMVPIQPYVNYYKLTPFILAFFGLLYLVPEIITTFGGKLVLFNFSRLLESARQSEEGSRESRKAAIGQLALDLHHRVTNRITRHNSSSFRRLVAKTMPSLPFCIQLQRLSSKLVFVLAAILPLVFLQNYIFLNVDLQGQIEVKKSNGSNQVLFPNDILCSFDVRVFGNIQRYSVQCKLPANDLFEKLSLLVCLLAIVVCTISVSDVISCLISPIFASRDYLYIKRHMRAITDITGGYDEKMLRDFVERYLKSDVIYLLQLIGENSSDHVVCQILVRLWEGYAGSCFSENKTRSSSQDEKKLLELQEHFIEGTIA